MGKKIFYFIIFVFLFLIGCASIMPPDVEIQTTSQYLFYQEKEGLKIAIDPYTDRDRVKTYFGIDLLAEGVLPLLVIAENHNNEYSFFMQKDSILFATNIDVPSTKPTKITESSSLKKQEQELVDLGNVWANEALLYRTVEYNPDLLGSSIVFTAVGAVLIYDQIATSRKKNVFEYNFIEKEWLDKILYPGASSHGFVYFRFQNHTMDDVSTILLKVKNVTNGDIVIFNIPLSKIRD